MENAQSNNRFNTIIILVKEVTVRMYRLSIIFFLFFSIQCFSQNNLDKGRLLLEQKEYVQAETFFLNYLDEYPDNLEVRECLGDLYGYQERWDKAIEYYRYLVEQKPKVANYHYKYGGVLGMKALQNKLAAIGLIDDIEDHFVSAAKLDKTHIDARWALVKFYVELPGILGGTKAKAHAYADELLALSAVDGYLAKGFIYKSSKDYKDAEENLRSAVKIGGSVTCYKELVALYLEEEKYQSALALLQEAYEKHSYNNFLYEIGKISAEQELQISDGELCLEKYIKNYHYSDSYPLEWAYLRLAQLARYKNKKDTALSYIDKSLAIRADFSLAKKERIKILKL
ncbi:tetratricopeptide repeat protein [Neptunitalea lumnitzerae]|uniref:tetratricopeptide repeat protein n=1 Tax=Neptunitalea lumnitzerae TaxID=2965509 RepID=UPI002493C091|nr:tetratricopeptide repeat protein [Neptunitalea sp. Y10]